MANPSRRDALVTIAAAGFSAPRLGAQGPYSPKSLAPEDFELLGDLVDLILPPSDTPGAKQAGVHAIIDSVLAHHPADEVVVKAGLWRLRAVGFQAMEQEKQIAVLSEYSASDGEPRRFFETLKSLTIDAYYSTEVGLVDELGYKGNTFLAEFPGCTHDHQIEEAD
jgi:hypothetical protein